MICQSHFNLVECARSESGSNACSFANEPEVVRSFARVFPRALGARMHEGDGLSSLTSLASKAPLADLNCTRREGGGLDETISCASITEKGVKKKRKNKRHTTR